MFKCPRPISRTPPHVTEVPTGTVATRQVDLISAQQKRKEKELQVDVSVRRQPPLSAGNSSQVAVVNTDTGPPISTGRQVEALGPAPPQPPLEGSEQASFMDFTATEQEEVS